MIAKATPPRQTSFVAGGVMAAGALAMLVQGIWHTAYPPIFITLAVLTVVACYLARERVAVLLFVMVPLGPLLNLVPLYRDPYLYNTEVVLLCYAAYWFAKRGAVVAGLGGISRIYLLFFLTLIPGVVVQFWAGQGIAEMRLLRGFYLGLCLVFLFEDRRLNWHEGTPYFVKTASVAGAAIVLVGLLDWLYLVAFLGESWQPPQSLFSNSEVLAIFLVWFLPVAALSLRHWRQRHTHGILWGGLIGGTVLLLATRSRAAILSLTLVALVYGWRWAKHRRRRLSSAVVWVGLGLLILVGGVVGWKTFAGFGHGLGPDGSVWEWGFQSRALVWQRGAALLVASPLWGNGPVANVYNTYLQVAVSFGVLAGAVFVVLVLWGGARPFLSAIRHRNAANNNDTFLIRGMGWGLLAVLLTSLGESTLGNELAYLQWTTLLAVATLGAYGPKERL